MPSVNVSSLPMESLDEPSMGNRYATPLERDISSVGWRPRKLKEPSGGRLAWAGRPGCLASAGLFLP
jgi:hypothetical protein